jgi:hypothetical protein
MTTAIRALARATDNAGRGAGAPAPAPRPKRRDVESHYRAHVGESETDFRDVFGRVYGSNGAS